MNTKYDDIVQTASEDYGMFTKEEYAKVYKLLSALYAQVYKYVKPPVHPEFFKVISHVDRFLRPELWVNNDFEFFKSLLASRSQKEDV
jgi:hypothetical protein